MQSAPNGWQLPIEPERCVKPGLKHTFLVTGIALQDSGGYERFQSAGFCCGNGQLYQSTKAISGKHRWKYTPWNGSSPEPPQE